MAEGIVIQDGTVTEVPSSSKGIYEVKMEDARIVLARASSELVRNRTIIIVGDSVKVEMSPYDLTKGRITQRNSPKK